MKKIIASLLFITSCAFATLPVKVSGAYVKAPQGPNTAAYMTLTHWYRTFTINRCAVLLCTESGASHPHPRKGVMKMRAVPAMDIAPGQSLTLERGGDHIMFFNADKAQLHEGAVVPVTLIFDGHDPLTCACPVKIDFVIFGASEYSNS